MKISRQGGLKSGQRLEKIYEILVSHEAEKYYKRQDKDTMRRLNKCVDNLSNEPLFGPHLTF